jgi:hypothetical protein
MNAGGGIGCRFQNEKCKLQIANCKMGDECGLGCDLWRMGVSLAGVLHRERAKERKRERPNREWTPRHANK